MNGESISHKPDRDWLDYVEFVVEIVALAFLIAYTVYAGLQWCEMRKSTKTAQETLVRSQRPWLVNDGPATYEIGQYFKEQDLTGVTFTFQVKNFGPSPGLGVGEGIQPSIRTSGDTHEFDDARKKACQVADGMVSVSSQTIFPQQTISYSNSEFISNLGNRKVVLFYGCIAYRDQFDTKHTTHHTTFCLFGPIAEPHSLGGCGINEEAD